MAALTKKKSKKRGKIGGRREGAGRKTIFKEKMEDCTIALPASAIASIDKAATQRGTSWSEEARRRLLESIPLSHRS